MNRREFCKNTFLAAISGTCAGKLLANIPGKEPLTIADSDVLHFGNCQSTTVFYGRDDYPDFLGATFVDMNTGKVFTFDGVAWIHTSYYFKGQPENV